MPLHSFVDESKEPTYLMVAALVEPHRLALVRRVVTALNLPRQRYIHFNNERDNRRTQIVSALCDLPLEAIIVEAAGKQRENQARLRCLRFLARDHINRQVDRLIIERDDSHVESDRQLLRQELEKTADPDRMRYDHLRGFEEPLLTIPDAVAWCWAHGGHWRVKVRTLVTEFYEV